MNFNSGDRHCVQTSTSRSLPIGVQQEVWETTCEDLQVRRIAPNAKWVMYTFFNMQAGAQDQVLDKTSWSVRPGIGFLTGETAD